MPSRLALPPLPLPRSARRPLRRGWTGAAYAAVLLAAIGSAWWQPGRTEAPAHTAALLRLAHWAAGGLTEVEAPDPPEPDQPALLPAP